MDRDIHPVIDSWASAVEGKDTDEYTAFAAVMKERFQLADYELSQHEIETLWRFRESEDGPFDFVGFRDELLIEIGDCADIDQAVILTEAAAQAAGVLLILVREVAHRSPAETWILDLAESFEIINELAKLKFGFKGTI